MKKQNSPRIAIFGAGPSGIAAGKELLKQGFNDFTIFEKSDGVGGTWHVQDYPGLACDVWAHSYTFSYAPNPDWSASFVEQPEIEAYLQRCATTFGLDKHIKLNTEITRAIYQPGGHWLLHSANGESFECDIIISAMGNQHSPLLPSVEGMDTFEGPSWHSTDWNHDVDLSGKRVVIVGSAASAVQIVPEVAKVAGQLTVLQRTPNWIMSRGRKPYSERRKRLYRRFPLFIEMTRKFQHFLMSFVSQATTIGHKRMKDFENTARKFIEKTVKDPALQATLTPDSDWGCKRGLVSDDFYPALQRDNVELVASGLQKVLPNGIQTSDGRQIDADVLIYCTGYRIQDYDRIDIVGPEGKSLADAMGDNPRAHKGIAVPGFPNFFFTVGPNGLVLNVSFFISAERNVETIVNLLDGLRSAGAKTLEVSRAAFDEYNGWLGERFANYSWGSPSCNSYYQNASGHSTFLFAGEFKDYRAFHEAAGIHEYELGYDPAPATTSADTDDLPGAVTAS